MMMLKNRQVFIVEDNTQNRTIFHMALVKHGACVDFERWGQDAVFHLRQMRAADLIVLDLMLAHGISGFDLYREIRALPKFANTPIVAVSAMDFATGAPKARDLGFSGFISKPINNQLFPVQVSALINGEQVWYEKGRNLS